MIIGLIETDNRKALRKVVLQFIESIKNDPMYNTISSVSGSKDWYLHARSDHPEIRAKFFEVLRNAKGFSAHLAIAKKTLLFLIKNTIIILPNSISMFYIIYYRFV